MYTKKHSIQENGNVCFFHLGEEVLREVVNGPGEVLLGGRVAPMGRGRSLPLFAFISSPSSSSPSSSSTAISSRIEAAAEALQKRGYVGLKQTHSLPNSTVQKKLIILLGKSFDLAPPPPSPLLPRCPESRRALPPSPSRLPPEYKLTIYFF